MKKLVKIIACLVLVVTLTACGSKEESKEESKSESNSVQEKEEETKVPAPAKDTEELLSSMEKVEVKSISTDKIELSEKVAVEDGEEVAVWMYSEPKFLGFFKVKTEKGKKVIEGLEAALKKQTIESGKHNIAIVTENGKNIGYIDIYLYDDGEMVSQKDAKIVKEEKKEEVVKYTTKKQNDDTLEEGKTEVIQKGENGTKEITYKVTYNADGKEIKREKVSEKVTKQAKEEIIKVGTATVFKIGDVLSGTADGLTCTELNSDGLCDDKGTMFHSFYGKGGMYVYFMNAKKLDKPIKASKTSEFIYTTTYEGKKWYLDLRQGENTEIKITAEKCKEYSLGC